MSRTITGTARSVKRRVLGGTGGRSGGSHERPVLVIDGAVDTTPNSSALQARLDAIQMLSPVVDAARATIDADRRLPDELTAAMHEAQLSTTLVPARFGGAALPLLDGVRVVEAVARLDGSAGWNTWVIVGHGRTAEHMSADAASAVFSTGRRTIAGSLSPTGRAEKAAGGYRLTGRWNFGSATAMSDYIQTGAFATERGRAVRRADGHDLQLGLIVPVEACTIVDTWFTTGLRGTASNDIVVDDVFVPDSMVFDEQRFWRPLGDEDVEFGRPYDEFSPPLMAAVAVGVASQALDTYVEIARGKSRAGQADWINRLAIAHDTIGRARVRLDAARSYLHAVARGLDALSPSAPSVGVHAKASCAHVVQECIGVVDSLYEAGGGSAIYRSSPLERCFRDVHVVSHHVLVAQRSFGDRGRIELDE